MDSIPQNLAIVSFSIDKNHDHWEKTTQKDKISWYNISDGKGDIGTIKTQYDLQGIPMSFLINENGIIIKKFLGFDPDKNLINELKKIMANNNV